MSRGKTFYMNKYSNISKSTIYYCLLIFCCKVKKVQICKQLAGKGHVVTKIEIVQEFSNKFGCIKTVKHITM